MAQYVESIKAGPVTAQCCLENKERKYKHVPLMLLVVGLRLLVEFGQSLN